MTVPDPNQGPEAFQALRDLVVGPERRRLDHLEQEFDAAGLTPDAIAEHLPEAIALRAGQDHHLARALGPTVESAISESVRRNPRQIATAIFPVLGPAIRKAIAEAMSGLVRSINTAIEHSFSVRGLRWRWESLRTGIPYAQIVIKHALLYRVEQVFLIHAETGLLLCHAAPPDLKVADADLISGMLTAIQDFVSDSFATAESGGKLRTFSVGELTVMVEPGPQAVLAAVVRGQAPDTLLPRLQDALENLHYQLAGPFAAFDGDAAPFEAARPALEACLETVLSTDRREPRTGPGPWLVWAVPIALIILIAGGLSARSSRRWNAAVARLRAEPGLVVVSAERSGGRLLFSGLRDPLAADPRAVLAPMGVDTTTVDGQFSPFLSLEPEMITARARRVLKAPETVTFSLRGDTLVARGTAPVAWNPSTGGTPAGVERVDWSGVEPVLPPEAARLKTEIERSRVLFEVGSASLVGTETQLRQVAAGFERLVAAAGGRPGSVRLDLIGRTDPTGTDATNQALSRLRGEAVGNRLSRLGIPAGVITAIGVGIVQPLAEPNAADRARVNRSVSFVVRLVRAE